MDKLFSLTGVFGLLLFFFTGFYMKQTFPDLYGGDEVIRAFMRADHIYQLMIAGILTMMGFAYAGSDIQAKKLALLKYILLVAAFILVTMEFFAVAGMPDKFERPGAFYAAVFAITASGITFIETIFRWVKPR